MPTPACPRVRRRTPHRWPRANLLSTGDCGAPRCMPTPWQRWDLGRELRAGTSENGLVLCRAEPSPNGWWHVEGDRRADDDRARRQRDHGEDQELRSPLPSEEALRPSPQRPPPGQALDVTALPVGGCRGDVHGGARCAPSAGQAPLRDLDQGPRSPRRNWSRPGREVPRPTPARMRPWRHRGGRRRRRSRYRARRRPAAATHSS